MLFPPEILYELVNGHKNMDICFPKPVLRNLLNKGLIGASHKIKLITSKTYVEVPKVLFRSASFFENRELMKAKDLKKHKKGVKKSIDKTAEAVGKREAAKWRQYIVENYLPFSAA